MPDMRNDDSRVPDSFFKAAADAYIPSAFTEEDVVRWYEAGFRTREQLREAGEVFRVTSRNYGTQWFSSFTATVDALYHYVCPSPAYREFTEFMAASDVFTVTEADAAWERMRAAAPHLNEGFIILTGLLNRCSRKGQDFVFVLRYAPERLKRQAASSPYSEGVPLQEDWSALAEKMHANEHSISSASVTAHVNDRTIDFLIGVSSSKNTPPAHANLVALFDAGWTPERVKKVAAPVLMHQWESPAVLPALLNVMPSAAITKYLRLARNPHRVPVTAAMLRGFAGAGMMTPEEVIVAAGDSPVAGFAAAYAV